MSKRITIVLLALLLAITLLAVIGCGGNKEATTTQETTIESTAPVVTSPPAPPEPQGIPWNEAAAHVGEQGTVTGPVVSTRLASSSKGQPTFLNVGAAYPSPNRFTVVVWIENRSNFPSPPENMYAGKTIAVTGAITSYQGSPQIEVSSPSQIQVQ